MRIRYTTDHLSITLGAILLVVVLAFGGATVVAAIQLKFWTALGFSVLTMLGVIVLGQGLLDKKEGEK